MGTIALEFVCIGVIRLCHYQCRQRFVAFHGLKRGATRLYDLLICRLRDNDPPLVHALTRGSCYWSDLIRLG